jgi:serine/threonine protein kinase
VLSKEFSIHIKMLIRPIITDKYIVDNDPIGTGAYASVYKTLQNQAIKTIPHKENMGIPCILECILMSMIRHPNLIYSDKIFIDSSKMNPILCMSLPLAISDLGKYRNQHSVTFEQIKTWSYQLIQAVRCLHKLNVIHSDIKIANILLYSDQSIKLTDYTLSVMKWTKDSKYTHLTSTITHRPVEVWLQTMWNESIDIYALGCTLYEMLMGKVLFTYQGISKNVKNELELKVPTLQCLFEWYRLSDTDIEKYFHSVGREQDYILFKQEQQKSIWKSAESKEKILHSTLEFPNSDIKKEFLQFIFSLVDLYYRPNIESVYNTFCNLFHIKKEKNKISISISNFDYHNQTNAPKKENQLQKENQNELQKDHIKDQIKNDSLQYTKNTIVIRLATDIYKKIYNLIKDHSLCVKVAIWIASKIVLRKGCITEDVKRLLYYEAIVCEYLQYNLIDFQQFI